MALGGMAIAGGAALLGIANKSAETADRVDKMSQKVRMSREGFQEWDHAISQSGGNIEGLQMGMKKLTDAMDGAAQGSSGNIETFERLGISMEEVENSSPEEMFETLVKKFNEMPDSAEKAALANDVFGRSATDLAPLLNSSSEEVNRLKQEAHDLGLVMSDEAVDAGVLFGDTMANVKDSFSMLVTNIGIEVMPMIQQFLDWVIANMPTIQAVAKEVFTKVADFVKAAVDIFQTYFVPIISAVIDWVKTNWPTIKNVIETVLNTAKDIISAVTTLIKNIWDKWGDQILSALKTVWDIIKNVIETTINVIKGIIETVTALIKGDWEGVWNGIKAIFTSIWDGIKGHVDIVINAIKGIIKNVTDSIKTTWSNVWNGIKQTTSDIWEGIKSAIMTPIEWVRDKVKGVIDTIKGFFNFKITWPKIPMPHFGIRPSGWKIGDLLRGSIPTLGIDWYAEGGIFDKPTLFNTPYGLKGVGEAGPEVVAPLSRLQNMLDFNNNADLLAEVIELLKEIRDKNQDLYLDGERLVGYLIDYVDERLGEKQRQKELAFGGA